MKKSLLIALLLIPFLGFSQTKKPVDGFLGIKFGTGKEEVISALKARGCVLNGGATGDEIYFTNVKLGPRLSEGLIVSFTDNKLYYGSFYFKPEHEAEVFEYYKALVNDIADVYGKGKSTAVYNSPYKEGDGDELQAVKAGEAKIFTDFKDEKNLLQVKIKATKDYDVYIFATYFDNTLVAEAQAKEKAKAKADY